MAAPTLAQQASIFALRSTEYDGAVITAKLSSAIASACDEIQNDNGSNLSLDRALSIIDGFHKEQLVAITIGTPLVPDSSSVNPTLAFIGRLIEIYGA